MPSWLLGWTLIYKCSGVLNLAMGELTLIGAYVCLTFYNWGIPFIPALILTLVVGFVLGLLTEHLFLRPMVGEPILSVIMVTVGLSFFFKGMVEFIWGTDTVVFTPPVFPMEPHLYREDRCRSGLPLGLRCLPRPSPCLCLLLQIHQVGPIDAGNGR